MQQSVSAMGEVHPLNMCFRRAGNPTESEAEVNGTDSSFVAMLGISALKRLTLGMCLVVR